MWGMKKPTQNPRKKPRKPRSGTCWIKQLLLKSFKDPNIC